MRREISTSYLLLAMSAFGFSGLHRFYLGKPVTGLLWFMTMGLGGIGTLYDALTMGQQVRDANQRMLPAGRERPIRAIPERTSASMPFEVPLELRVLKVARQQRGRLTVMQAAAELGERTEAVEKVLDELCHKGHASVEVSEDGVLFYDFPELRFR